VRLDDGLRDEEPEPQSLAIPAVELAKGVEEAMEVGLRDSLPRIAGAAATI
jgi:hypothetical protein